ncbi:TIGR03943 family putative permease subunit [Gloeothece citriformis]|nr:TIGR03943 family protein [Gloeothece citriformis]
MTSLAKLKTLNFKFLLPGLDVLALLGWGALLLKYWLTGQLKLLIHPNYFLLVLVTGLVLLGLGGYKGWLFVQSLRKRPSNNTQETVQHITLFPPGWGSGLLILTALAGFLINPGVLSSQVALQRGVSEALPITREQPQAFVATVKPEDRTLIDWVRTLNVYPEPDAYTGQKVNLKGFVVHLPQLPEDYLLLTRFILTCCAVDAYPVGLPVKLETNRNQYPPDTWLQVEGEMMTETLRVNSQTLQATDTEKRQLVIKAKTIKKIPTPSDPYGY